MAKFLLLAGTNEAIKLAQILALQGGHDVILSYAGRTNIDEKKLRQKINAPCEIRIGGFGEVSGLIEYIKHYQIAGVVDATHPFAKTMKSNAIKACEALNHPLFCYQREKWQRPNGTDWHEFTEPADLMNCLPAGAKPFLTIGQEAMNFIPHRLDLHYVVRAVMLTPFDTDKRICMDKITFIQAYPKAHWHDEKIIMKDNKITHLIAKNSGGRASYAKITAALNLKIPIYLWQAPSLLNDNEKALIYNFTDIADLANFIHEYFK